MFKFEKEILKREGLNPVCSYPYKVIPVTDEAKLSFAYWNKKRGPIPTKIKDLLAYLNTDKRPFVGQVPFYTEESEEHYIQETKYYAIFNMAESFIPGVGHPKSDRKGIYLVDLEEGKDYTIEVGPKIVHESFTLTYDDIKAL